jgi:hypothetical protein
MQRPGLEPYAHGWGQCEAAWGAARREKRERLPGALGHGQVATACGKVDAVASAIEPCNEPEARCTHRGKARSEWRMSLGHNGHGIPHDGPR